MTTKVHNIIWNCDRLAKPRRVVIRQISGLVLPKLEIRLRHTCQSARNVSPTVAMEMAAANHTFVTPVLVQASRIMSRLLLKSNTRTSACGTNRYGMANEPILSPRQRLGSFLISGTVTESLIEVGCCWLGC